MKKWVLGVLLLTTLLFAGASVGAQSGNAQGAQVAHAMLQDVSGSGISGFVLLRQTPQDESTKISVIAFGLQPGQDYVSLYYDADNPYCDLVSEPEAADEPIGDGAYTANGGGVGLTMGEADDGLDELGSVSVRSAEDINVLYACATIQLDEDTTSEAGS